MKKKTLTLSEIVLAAGILVIALCAVMLELVTCATLNATNRKSTRAATHAQHIMEEIQDTPFASIASDSLDATAIAARGLTPLAGETITTTVGGTSTLLDITVSVSWDDRGGRSRSTALRTLRAEP